MGSEDECVGRECDVGIKSMWRVSMRGEREFLGVNVCRERVSV